MSSLKYVGNILFLYFVFWQRIDCEDSLMLYLLVADFEVFLYVTTLMFLTLFCCSLVSYFLGFVGGTGDWTGASWAWALWLRCIPALPFLCVPWVSQVGGHWKWEWVYTCPSDTAGVSRHGSLHCLSPLEGFCPEVGMGRNCLCESSSHCQRLPCLSVNLGYNPSLWEVRMT